MHIELTTCVAKADDTSALLRQTLSKDGKSLIQPYRIRLDDLMASLSALLAMTTDAQSRESVQNTIKAIEEANATAEESIKKLSAGELTDAEGALDIIEELSSEALDELREDSE